LLIPFDMFGFARRRRRRIAAQPFPEGWLRVLERNVPYFRCLTPEDQKELQGHIQVFLAEKRFEGLGKPPVVITDEVRVTIAAQACILLLHRDTDYYPSMKSILVYPGRYVAPMKELMGTGMIIEGGMSVRAGESWHRGSVVLSWSDVQAGTADACDGQNVVFHEFAHQIDSESGAVEGAPALESRTMYQAWARAFQREYNALVNDLRWGRPTLLGAYAATNPAEFFAVATEMFFERPWDLKAKHPELYGQMREFFKQDPAERYAACGMCGESGEEEGEERYKVKSTK
jgi:Mlc titration factor MtfA (ptsG expression regulator)